MKILKIKAKIYQYTGIYLAESEELDYLNSREFWKEFDRMQKHNKENDISNRTLQGILIGTWQSKNGFTRQISPYGFKYFFKAPWYVKPLIFINLFYLQLKQDLKNVNKK